MSEKVKVKVADHHSRTQFSIGDEIVSKNKAKEVEPNLTVANAVKAGTLQVVEGEIPSQFRGDDRNRAKGADDDGENAEQEEPKQVEEDLEQHTKDELKEIAEERGLKKSGTKSELVERLKNQ